MMHSLPQSFLRNLGCMGTERIKMRFSNDYPQSMALPSITAERRGLDLLLFNQSRKKKHKKQRATPPCRTGIAIGSNLIKQI